ncbi:DUF4158 domain-containing protein [Sinorhizobium fredii]|uniref:DUF4158 domain-containing protein n=1 Tax=Rhizobium fredii TaxID=380 RepID=UPI0013E8A82A|nr:DUF4158 domain-containing protein [Sinorhizobium fredii]
MAKSGPSKGLISSNRQSQFVGVVTFADLRIWIATFSKLTELAFEKLTAELAAGPWASCSRWSLSFSDIEFVTGKPVSARLGLAAQLKFFMTYGFLVQDRSAIPADGLSYLAE